MSGGLGPFGTTRAETEAGESAYGLDNPLAGTASPLLGYLYRRLDGAFGYPFELRQAKMIGEVRAVLRFNAQGEWLGEAADFQALSAQGRYFRIYLLRRLRPALAEPIPENIRKTEPGPLTVEAEFVFDVRPPEPAAGADSAPPYAAGGRATKAIDQEIAGGHDSDRRPLDANPAIYGHKFYFYRIHRASSMEWRYGPFAGIGILPSVGIDPNWFVDKVTDFLHHRDPVDPLQAYRDDPDW